MKSAVPLTVAIILWLPSVTVFATSNAANPVRVAILDSPLDYENPKVSPYLDFDLLNAISIPWGGQAPMSLYEINQRARTEYERDVIPSQLAQYMDFWAHVNFMKTIFSSRQVPTPLILWRFLTNWSSHVLRYSASSQFRNGVRMFLEYLHGSVVSELIAATAPTNLRLINIPMFGDNKNYYTSPRFAPQRDWHHDVSAISAALRQGHVRVANLSLGSSPDWLLDIYRDWHPFGSVDTALFRQELLQKLAEDSAKHIAFLNELVNANPNVIFVLTAGNAGMDLDADILHSAKIEAPNLIKVGSVDAKQNLSTFTNRSARYVQVYAPGEDFYVAAIGTKWPGTSFAQAEVTTKLARVVVTHPELAPAQTIALFLENDTQPGPDSTYRVLRSQCDIALRPSD